MISVSEYRIVPFVFHSMLKNTDSDWMRWTDVVQNVRSPEVKLGPQFLYYGPSGPFDGIIDMVDFKFILY